MVNIKDTLLAAVISVPVFAFGTRIIDRILPKDDEDEFEEDEDD